MTSLAIKLEEVYLEFKKKEEKSTKYTVEEREREKKC